MTELIKPLHFQYFFRPSWEMMCLWVNAGEGFHWRAEIWKSCWWISCWDLSATGRFCRNVRVSSFIHWCPRKYLKIILRRAQFIIYQNWIENLPISISRNKLKFQGSHIFTKKLSVPPDILQMVILVHGRTVFLAVNWQHRSKFLNCYGANKSCDDSSGDWS